MSVFDPTSERAYYETPPRSLIQRMEALEKANEIRTYRSVLKEDLKEKRADARDLLMDPPEKLETMKVGDLLLATPKRGHTKVNRMLVQCRISSAKTIGGLSERQRNELVSMLRR